MANKDEIVYECGPSEPEEIIEERPEVSFIPDVKGNLLQQTFSICPKTDDEGLREKYNRLRSELILLHERIDYDNQKAAELKQENIDDVQNYLMALKGMSIDSSRNDIQDPLRKRVNVLNTRIMALEWTLGIDVGQHTSSSTFPLFKTLEDLRVRISLLAPDMLTRANKRLQDTHHEIRSARSDKSLDSIALTRDSANLPRDSVNLTRDDKANEIATMHELIKRWDSSCKELPSIISHLAASRKLHEDSERVCRKYDQFMALKFDIAKSMQFQRNFEELCDKQNKERLESIKQRIVAIQERKQ